MSVALTNCGQSGWVTDRTGYRYDSIDPVTGDPWPAMPRIFDDLAREAAEATGFDSFRPDACLINRYAPGARLSFVAPDRNERDFDQPIESVSLGLPAVFLGAETNAPIKLSAFGCTTRLYLPRASNGDPRPANLARIPDRMA